MHYSFFYILQILKYLAEKYIYKNIANVLERIKEKNASSGNIKGGVRKFEEEQEELEPWMQQYIRPSRHLQDSDSSDVAVKPTIAVWDNAASETPAAHSSADAHVSDPSNPWKR